MYAREAYTLCYFFNLYKWGSYVNAYVRAPLFFLNADTFYRKYQHSLITVIIVIIIAIIVVISIRQ